MQSLALGQQALELLPEDNLFLRGIVARNLGITYMFSGEDPHVAARMLEEAARIGERVGSVVGAVVALCNLAELRIAQGQLQDASTLYDRALALAVDDRGHQFPIGGMAVIGIGELLREWNELKEAARHLMTGIALTGPGMPIWALDGYLALARVKQAQGEFEGAQKAVDMAQELAIRFDATDLDDWIVAALQARLWIAQGDLDAAMRWAEGRGLVDRPATDPGDTDGSDSLYHLYEFEHITLAALWIAKGQPERALEGLDPLLTKSGALGRIGGAIQIWALKALAHQQQGRRDQALNALAQALSLVEPEGYVRTFVDSGPAMARLLRQALAQGIAADYVQQFLAAFGPEKG